VHGKIVKFIDNPGARDYQRMTLGEVENYIRTNLRLPRVGENKGIFDRSDAVLEKVEELFTYVIELKHELDALKEKKDDV